MHQKMRFFIPILLLVFFAFVLTSWMDYRNSKRILEISLIENQLLIAREIRNTLTSSIQNIKETANVVMKLPLISNLVLEINSNANTLKIGQHVLKSILAQENTIENIALFNTQHEKILDAIHDPTELTRLDLFKEALHGNASISYDISKQTQAARFLYIAPITLDGTVSGVMCITMNMKPVVATWEAILPRHKGYVARLLSSDGQIIASSNSSLQPINNIRESPSQQILEGPHETLVTYRDNNVDLLGSYILLPYTDWRILVTVNKEEAFATINNFFGESLAINGLTALILLLTIFELLNRLIKTIQKLEEQNRTSLIQDKEQLEKRITERTFALNTQNLRLHEQFQSLNTILETSPVCMSLTSKQGKVLYTNPAATRFFKGNNNEQISFEHYQNSQDRNRISTMLAEGTPVQNLLLNMRNAQGKQCRMLISASLIHYEGEEVELRWYIDLTDEHNAKEALEVERALLRTIFDTIPDIIFYKSVEGVYLTYNKAFSLLCNCSRDDLIGKTDDDVFAHAPEGIPAYLEADTTVINTRQTVAIEETVTTHDGQKITLETIKTPCLGENNTVLGVLGISRNITDRKAIEFALIEAREQAQAASKAKSDFIANMSHEIRTPMNGIMGLSHLALQVQALPEKVRDYLLKIDYSAKSLLCIINDILDFSKNDAGKLNIESILFQLPAVIENVMQPLMPTFTKKKLELQLTIEENIPPLLTGDPIRLGQILMNLIGNALKFTETGHITVTIRMLSQNSTHCTLCFTVTDTGIGIAAEHLSLLFSPFMQADTSVTRRYGGTGLGLSICKSLVQLMGGEISVDSVMGKGTTFTFTAQFLLPEQEPDTRTTTNPIAPQDLFQNAIHKAQLHIHTESRCNTVEGDLHATPSSCVQTTANSTDMPLLNKRVLLAEDNEINQLIAFEMLTSYGLDVTLANNGCEAVRLAQTEPFDAVLMDIQMPEMDGIKATKIIRSQNKTTPIIAMTAHAMDGDREQSLRAGMQAHITKPIDPEEMHSTLVQWILGEQPETRCL